MDNKYTKDNIRINYFVSTNPHESELYVNKYITETWNFDGQTFNKSTVDKSADVKIPVANYGVDEFLAYVDDLVRMRDYLIQLKPIKPITFKE